MNREEGRAVGDIPVKKAVGFIFCESNKIRYGGSAGFKRSDSRADGIFSILPAKITVFQ